MPYCPRCGVETEASVRTCPLCETAIPRLDDAESLPRWPHRSPDDPNRTFATPEEWQSRVFVLVSSLVGIASLVVLVADVALQGALTWSRWPLASLFLVLTLFATFLVGRGSATAWGVAFVTVAAYLVALDAFDGALTWAPTFALPTWAAAALAAWAVVWGSTRKPFGYQRLAWIPGSVLLFLVALDALVTHFATGQWGLGWSWVTDLILAPLVLVLLVLHFGWRRTPDLRRIFHF